MTGGGRAPNRPAPPPPVASSSSGGGQILPPLRRHLAFSSTKPPFVPPDDYHRFSTDARKSTDQEPEAIVVRSPVSSVVYVFTSLNVCGFVLVLANYHWIAKQLAEILMIILPMMMLND